MRCLRGTPQEKQAPISLVDGDLRTLPAVLVESTELTRDLIGKASYEPDAKDGLTGYVLATGETLNVPGGENARTAKLRQLYPNASWKGKWTQKGSRWTKQYCRDRPFLGVAIVGVEGIVLGVIRIGDSTKGKMEFNENDRAILETCAAEVAIALEANAVGHFLNRILGELSSLRERYAEINQSYDSKLAATFLDGRRLGSKSLSTSLFLCSLVSVCASSVAALLAITLFHTGQYVQSGDCYRCRQQRSPAQKNGARRGDHYGKLRQGAG